MNDDDLNDRLRATFVQELEEQVRELNRGLLALEQRPSDHDHVRALFRSAHTIKGAARVAGVPVVERVCHAMESVFANLRDGTQSLSGADFSLLFATCDGLQDAAARLRAAEPLVGSVADALLPQVEALADRAAPSDARTPAARAPTSRADRSSPSAPSRPGATASAPPESEPVESRGQHREAEAEPEPQDAAAADGAPADVTVQDVEPADELVRVSAERLDTLMSAVGELIIATGRIVDRSDRSDEDARRLDGATDHVADVVRRLRLRPFGDVCVSLPRAVRDVAAAEEKEVELVIEGEDTEADRMVIDALRDPLLHLVRNAVDHGIEKPAERERAGKPRQGTVRISAELSGGRLTVSVSDDGAGLDEDSIRRTLRDTNRPVPKSAEDLADALLAGGFSTRTYTTEISGRGVGLDIVRSALERIGGTVDVEWTEGAGTTFLLECPPTPATLRAVLVRLGSFIYALPTTHVDRLRRVRTRDLRSVTGGTVLPTSRGPIRVLSLARLLGPPLEPRPLEDTALVAIVSAGSRRAALIVDDVLDEDEIVMRPLAVGERAVAHTAGAAILPSGSVALVLAVSSLLAAGLRPGTAIAPPARQDTERRRQRILVADDSITTRTLEQSVLESAGYQVLTAVNGEDAWETLEREGADALVADVEMPRMDGFALCRRVRASERFRELPIVLVTGLESPEDRARGLEAGADAYIVKSGFNQATLLEAVHQLIGDT
ncbi:MAG TPA: response regulator [Longimicrobiales bacterium]|nr:response regulator [Longimicrobiales bacterium]